MKLIPFFLICHSFNGLYLPSSKVTGNGGGGWLDAIGYTDFAGSGVVHLCGAAAALAAVIILGPRTGKYGSDGSVKVMRGSNIPIAALGALILWLGWFGFNGGSQLAVNDAANANAVAQVFLNTNAAAAGGVIGALLIAKFLTGKADVTMAINGAIAGLVAITAAPDTPSGGLATIIGFIGGIIVYFSVVFLDTVLKIDDPVGAISAHGTVGIWGIMATPLLVLELWYSSNWSYFDFPLGFYLYCRYFVSAKRNYRFKTFRGRRNYRTRCFRDWSGSLS